MGIGTSTPTQILTLDEYLEWIRVAAYYNYEKRIGDDYADTHTDNALEDWVLGEQQIHERMKAEGIAVAFDGS